MNKLRTFYCVFLLLLLNLFSKGQEIKVVDSIVHKHVHNIIPRLGIGMSRHFISEIGIAYMRSNFSDIKKLGLNTNNMIYYASFEILTPYKMPIVYGYKVGFETINIGHVTSAGGIEIAYYFKDTNSSLAIIPKIGLPLINGSLSYGFSMFIEPSMRKEVGRHRIALTYAFNRKSDKALHSMLSKNRHR